MRPCTIGSTRPLRPRDPKPPSLYRTQGNSECFETPPGFQAQFDWSPYTIDLGGELFRVIVFCMVLGYSRRKHYTASLDETQASIFEAIESCLRHFGASPKQLLIDNAKAFVLDPNPAHFRWNPQFLELCGHYRIRQRT